MLNRSGPNCQLRWNWRYFTTFLSACTQLFWLPTVLSAEFLTGFQFWNICRCINFENKQNCGLHQKKFGPHAEEFVRAAGQAGSHN